MPTVKLVVIGASGVGKTSLRGKVNADQIFIDTEAELEKYISGRFSNGYRATIGADFISKTLPHPTQAEQTITLQIWVNIISFLGLLLCRHGLTCFLGYSWSRKVL
jgi:Ras-related protein Rab-7A